jgi:hypothetical protein
VSLEEIIKSSAEGPDRFFLYIKIKNRTVKVETQSSEQSRAFKELIRNAQNNSIENTKMQI